MPTDTSPEASNGSGSDLRTGESAIPSATPISAALNEQTERGARLREDWRNSPERRRVNVALAATLGVVAAAVVIAGWIGYANGGYEERLSTGAAAAFVTLVVLGYLGLLGFLLYRRQQRRAWYDRVVVLKAHKDLARAESEADAGGLDLLSLWSLTQRRLDYYHGLATGQAERSFNYGMVAAGVGFLVVIASAIVAALGRSTVGSVSAGLVGLAGGGLGAYIGGTFMRLQENAATQLRAYFSQPLVFSRFLAAERLLDQLDPQTRPLATRELIRALAATPVSTSRDDLSVAGEESLS